MDSHNKDIFDEKIHLLEKYVSKGEELLSNIQTWEKLAEIIDEREILIKKIQEIEVSLKENYPQNNCNAEQRDRINSLIKLISDIDQDAVKLIQEEQKKTIEDMKINQKHQKIIKYKNNEQSKYGTFLDTKK